MFLSQNKLNLSTCLSSLLPPVSGPLQCWTFHRLLPHTNLSQGKLTSSGLVLVLLLSLHPKHLELGIQ